MYLCFQSSNSKPALWYVAPVHTGNLPWGNYFPSAYGSFSFIWKEGLLLFQLCSYLFFLLHPWNYGKGRHSMGLRVLAAHLYLNPIHSDLGAYGVRETIMLKVTSGIFVSKSSVFSHLDSPVSFWITWVYVLLTILEISSFLDIHDTVLFLFLNLWLQSLIAAFMFPLLVLAKALHMYIYFVYIIQNCNGLSMW